MQLRPPPTGTWELTEPQLSSRWDGGVRGGKVARCPPPRVTMSTLLPLSPPSPSVLSPAWICSPATLATTPGCLAMWTFPTPLHNQRSQNHLNSLLAWQQFLIFNVSDFPHSCSYFSILKYLYLCAIWAWAFKPIYYMRKITDITLNHDHCLLKDKQ